MEDPDTWVCLDSGNRFWTNGEYLLWWIKDNPVPVPLATTALPPFTSDNPGALGDPDTRVLLGADDIDTRLRQGMRLTAGWWLDCERTAGMELSGFFLARRSVTRSVASDGSPDSAVIGVPFFDVTGATTLTGQPGEAFRVLSLGGVSAGRSSAAIPGQSSGKTHYQLPMR